MASVPLLGRDREIAQLTDALTTTLTGRGRIVLIAGEPGIGKTALVNEFLTQVKEQAPNVAALTSLCSFQTGAGDAFSPFRAVIEDLLVVAAEIEAETTDSTRRVLRGVGINAARALYEVAPDLLGTLIPMAGVALRAAQKLVGSLVPKADSGNLARELPDQISIMEQYLDLLEAIASEFPLVLVIEDLHWADESSLNLLSFLARRVDKAPILLVGTYRPTELPRSVNTPHPLLKIEREAIRYGNGQAIEVKCLTPESVSQYIADAFTESHFPADFASWVFERTEGNALFVAETLRQFVEAGRVEYDRGSWRLSGEVNRVEDLPESIEAVIEERISRVEPHLMDLLACSSVEGTEFAAQVVSQVCDEDERAVVNELVDALERGHCLVEEQGERQISTTQILSLFQFRHNLIREYIYRQHLVGAQRRLLHGRVGEALEGLYGEQRELIAPILAHHFDQAHNQERALYYLLLAGDRALEARALPEALRLFSRAASLMGEVGSDLQAEIRGLSETPELGLAVKLCFLRWAASLTSDSEQGVATIDQLAVALSSALGRGGEDAEELYQLALRVLMFLSEIAIQRQQASLYPHIETLNALVTTYLEAIDDHLAAAFRMSYLTWVAESLNLETKEVAGRATDQFLTIYRNAMARENLSEAFPAIEAAAFNAWRAGRYVESARLYSELCELLPKLETSPKALIAYGWLGARNFAWATERQLLEPTELTECRRSGAELFAQVAAELSANNSVSLSAARLYRKSLSLIPIEDVARRADIAGALYVVEQRNRREFSGPEDVHAAIVAEIYDPEASTENPLGDRIVSYLFSRGIICDSVLPQTAQELDELAERYALIVMQSGPRSPRPQGQFVLEIFGDSKDFDQLYLSRKHYFNTWQKEYRGATWVLFAGNGILLTMEAADQLIDSGALDTLAQSIRRDGS